jgi:SAM-dependent methyltransferase
MKLLISLLDKKLYPNHLDSWDDILFRKLILDQITPESIILDLGAGAGIVSQMNFLGIAGKVYGVDLDKRVLDNPFLDEGKLSDAGEIPYPDEHFDLVFCDNVFEHLENPEKVFKEVHRVLKSKGFFLFKTPNKFHYVPIIARFTPHCFHQFYNRLRGRKETDTFPTLYKANSSKDLRHLCKLTKFRNSNIYSWFFI